MKTIGILGGMSWESTLEYYRIINKEIQANLGGLHSAKILINSLDFAPLAKLMDENKWDSLSTILRFEAQALERSGAQGIILTTNTMHRVFPFIQEGVSIPVIHIADPVSQAFGQQEIKIAGLLGTRFTMEEDFLKDRLTDRGTKILIPPKAQRNEIHRIIFEELVTGKIMDSSRDFFRRVMEDLTQRGAEGMIFGCTEIGLLVSQNDCRVFVADTTQLHARAAAAWMLEA